MKLNEKKWKDHFLYFAFTGEIEFFTYQYDI